MIGAVCRFEFFVQRDGQVPAILKVRQDQFRLHRHMRVCDVAQTVETSYGSIRQINRDTRLYGKSRGPKLPAQFDRHEIGVEGAAEHVGSTRSLSKRTSDAYIHQRKDDHSVIGRTQESPARNKQETSVVVVYVQAIAVAKSKRGSPRPREVPLVGE